MPLARIKSQIDPKAFLQGLGVVALLYVLLFALIWSQSAQTITRLEERLASQTVLINRGKAPQHHAPAPDPAKGHAQSSAQNSKASAKVTTQAAHLTKQPLPAAPIEGLYEEIEAGLVPKIRPKDNQTPFQAYKRPFKDTGKPMIAILVKDFGLSDSSSQAAIRTLPSEVTLLLSPYSAHIDQWQSKARQAGHETWLTLAFETSEFPRSLDPGPKALLTSASLKQNQDNIEWALSRTTGYAGVAARTDKEFAAVTSMLQPLIKYPLYRGVGFLELNPQSPETIETIAIASNGPFVKADLVINGERHTTEGSPLKKLEFIAQAKGHAIGILNPYTESYGYLKTWLDTLEQKGFILVPVSAIAQRQLGDTPPPKATPKPTETDAHAPERSHAAPSSHDTEHKQSNDHH